MGMEVKKVPPRNPTRDLVNEEALARRIAHEREMRGWTYEGLAHRLTTDAGCPIQASAVYKIEKGSPRRRITVDEHVAFAAVFGVPMEELLIPPEIAQAQEIAGLLLDWRDRVRLFDEAAQAALAARTQLETAIEQHGGMPAVEITRLLQRESDPRLNEMVVELELDHEARGVRRGKSAKTRRPR